MAIIVAVALPALNAIRATALQAAARQVQNEMMLARQYAITHRTTVRFGICVDPTNPPNLGSNYVARAYIILAQTNNADGSLAGWVPVQDWRFLPDGIVFSDLNSGYYDTIDISVSADGLPPFGPPANRYKGAATSSSVAPQWFDNYDPAVTVYPTNTGATVTWKLSYVDFLSTGYLSSGSTHNGSPAVGVRLIQGTVLDPSPKILCISTNNWVYLEAAPYTGRVRIRYADSFNITP